MLVLPEPAHALGDVGFVNKHCIGFGVIPEEANCMSADVGIACEIASADAVDMLARVGGIAADVLPYHVSEADIVAGI